MMRDYVEYVGDYLLQLLGFPRLFLKANPVSALLMYVADGHLTRRWSNQFPFMENTAIGARANFFERRVSDYVGARVTRERSIG